MISLLTGEEVKGKKEIINTMEARKSHWEEREEHGVLIYKMKGIERCMLDCGLGMD